MMTRHPTSARANEASATGPRLLRIAGGFVLLAAIFLPVFPALGTDSPAPWPIARYPTVVLPLPANPYLETTPWLDWMPLRDELKIDTLQLPCGTLENMANDDVCRHRSADLPIS